jgi:glycosyltransferase involved in cell wall biosynthesis
MAGIAPRAAIPQGGMVFADLVAGAHRAHPAGLHMKIALISAHASPLGPLGGATEGAHGIYAHHLARALACAGHQVDVYTRREDLWSAPVIELAPNASVVHVPAGPPHVVRAAALATHMSEFASRVAGHAARTRYDVVHASFFLSGIAALHLKQRLGIPFVATLHSLGRALRRHPGCTEGFAVERPRIEDAIVAAAGRLLAGSDRDREDLTGLYGADARVIDVVPFGFDPAEFGPGARSARTRLGLGPDEFVLLHAGRLARGDGVDNVIRALARLRTDHGIAARLLVIGGAAEEPDPRRTPEIARLRLIATSHGVSGQVEFVGARPRAVLREYYGAADVFVTTPAYEPCALAPIEALACGIPVVGAAVSGIAHVVVDAVTGFLVPPDDPVALAERLARLRRNPELARAYGRAGIRCMRAGFTWRHIAARAAQAYVALLAPLRARLASAVS